LKIVFQIMEGRPRIGRLKHTRPESPLWDLLATLFSEGVVMIVSLPIVVAIVLLLPVSAAIRHILLTIHYKTHAHLAAYGKLFAKMDIPLVSVNYIMIYSVKTAGALTRLNFRR